MTVGYQGLYSLIGLHLWGNRNLFSLIFPAQVVYLLQVLVFTQFNVCNVRCLNSELSTFYLGLDLYLTAPPWELPMCGNNWLHIPKKAITGGPCSCSFTSHTSNSQPGVIKYILNHSTDACKWLLISILGWRENMYIFLMVLSWHSQTSYPGMYIFKHTG